MENEVQGARPKGTPKKTWTEIVQKDYQARKLNREDVMDHNRWKKQTKDRKMVVIVAIVFNKAQECQEVIYI